MTPTPRGTASAADRQQTPSRHLARRQFLSAVLAVGVLGAFPVTAGATTPVYYGQGFQTGGYR